MRLIIDIPEQMYLNAKADILCGLDIVVKAIKNGIPHETVTEFADRCRECGRERVLDKIRAEIIENAKSTMNDTRAEGLYVALNIVDKYRNEVSE